MSSACDGSVLRGANFSAVVYGISPHPGREEKRQERADCAALASPPSFSSVREGERHLGRKADFEDNNRLPALRTVDARYSRVTVTEAQEHSARLHTVGRFSLGLSPRELVSPPAAFRSRWTIVIYLPQRALSRFGDARWTVSWRRSRGLFLCEVCFSGHHCSWRPSQNKRAMHGSRHVPIRLRGLRS
jgi:hypothetical protein